MYGLKGMAAYAEHAFNLGKTSEEIFAFVEEALLGTMDDSLTAEQLIEFQRLFARLSCNDHCCNIL